MKKAVILVVLISNAIAFSQCTSQGPRNPNTYGQNTSVGSFAWTNADKILVSDNDRAYVGVLLGILGSANTHYITATNYGFTIPVTATICGIQVDVEQTGAGILIGSNIRDNSVRIIKNNAITGTNKATGLTWFGSDSYVSYGGNADTWGTTWTPADINSGNFGVAVSAHLSAGLASLFLTAMVDNIRIRVFYTNPLPVELLYFKAEQEDQRDITLSWATSSEINNDYFTIERSVDAINWEEIHNQSGSGNNNSIKEYTYTYNEVHNENLYFKLSQYDYDGTKSEFEMITVKPNLQLTRIYYQNSTATLMVNCATDMDEGTIEIINTRGTCIKTIKKEKDVTLIQIPVSDLSSDLYIVRISTVSNNFIEKIWLN